MVRHRGGSQSRRGSTDVCWERSQRGSHSTLVVWKRAVGRLDLGTSNACKPREWSRSSVCRWNWSTGQSDREDAKRKQIKSYNRICTAVCWHPLWCGGESWSAVVLSSPTEVFRDVLVPRPNTRLGNNTPPTYDPLGIFSWSWCSQLPDLKTVVYYFCAPFKQMPHSNPDLAWFQHWVTRSL